MEESMEKQERARSRPKREGTKRSQSGQCKHGPTQDIWPKGAKWTTRPTALIRRTQWAPATPTIEICNWKHVTSPVFKASLRRARCHYGSQVREVVFCTCTVKTPYNGSLGYRTLSHNKGIVSGCVSRPLRSERSGSTSNRFWVFSNSIYSNISMHFENSFEKSCLHHKSIYTPQTLWSGRYCNFNCQSSVHFGARQHTVSWNKSTLHNKITKTGSAIKLSHEDSCWFVMLKPAFRQIDQGEDCDTLLCSHCFLIHWYLTMELENSATAGGSIVTRAGRLVKQDKVVVQDQCMRVILLVEVEQHQ